MTRDEMKTKLDALAAKCISYGATTDESDLNVARRLRTEILAQIDLMFQGAADDESFEDRETSRRSSLEDKLDEIAARFDAENCSYCGEPVATDPMTHKDGDCLEAKILVRD